MASCVISWFGSCNIWIVQEMDHARFGSCKKWILQDLDLARNGSCKIWILQEMDCTRFRWCKIWIVQEMNHTIDLDCGINGSYMIWMSSYFYSLPILSISRNSWKAVRLWVHISKTILTHCVSTTYIDHFELFDAALLDH